MAYISIPSQCQVVKELKLFDSIVLRPHDSAAYCHDISLIDFNLIARFYKFITEDSIYIELASSSGLNKGFLTHDLSIYSENAGFIKTEIGYRLIKYSSINKIIDFDCNHNNLIERQIDVNLKKHMVYPTKTGLFRSSSACFDNKIWFARHSIDFNNKSEDKLASSYSHHFKKEQVILEYDCLSNKTLNTFGNYPEGYQNSPLFYTNKEISFAGDSVNKKIYLSFQGCHDVFEYDMTTHTSKKIYAKGHFMNDSLMHENTIDCERAINRNYYNLFLDSNDDLFVNNNKIFRVYKTHIPSSMAKGIKKSSNPNSCASPAVMLDWDEHQLKKPSYLQQISLLDSSIVEYKFPAEANTFIGYDNTNKYFYFRNHSLTNTQINRGKAVIYVYAAE